MSKIKVFEVDNAQINLLNHTGWYYRAYWRDYSQTTEWVGNFKTRRGALQARRYVMKVLVKHHPTGDWMLIIQNHSQVTRFYTVTKLIEAVELACTLQLHIDNISELPLPQYLKQGVLQ